MADRIRGIQVHRPIIYGSHARLLTDEERETAPPGHTHRWTIFLTSATSPPPKEGESEDMDYLPGGADDLSYVIRRVTFKLHETYTPSSRQIDKPPYKVTETGWGEFAINIRVQFVPEASEKPLNFAHSLKLHHWGPPIHAPSQLTVTDSPAPAPAQQPTTASSVVTPAPPATTVPNTPVAEGTVAAETPTEKKTEEKEGSGAPTEKVEAEKMQVDSTGEGTAEVKTETETPTAASTPIPTDTIVADQPTPATQMEATQVDIGETITAQAQHHHLSIASKLPVHSWQYDELVFSDPPSAFLEILNEHPATPLPAKLRRPRDQREREEGPKKKVLKGRASTSVSRAQTQEPTGASGTPAPTGPQVGIHGEPGSADVPLEFAKEMEIGEQNRLTDMKITIIEQMDKLRTRLIAQEKELSKLKAEMKVG